MEQPDLDFTGTGAARVSEPFPPHQGKTPLTRETSYSGAVHAAETRSVNIWKLRQLWREALTINDVAALAHLPVSSVCSLKAAMQEELEEIDKEMIIWQRLDGRKRTTFRARWRLKR